MAQVVSRTSEGVATFAPLVLGRPDTPASQASGGSNKAAKGSGKATPAAASGDADGQETEAFAPGLYTLRFSTEGFAPVCMRLIVVGEGGGKKGKKK